VVLDWYSELTMDNPFDLFLEINADDVIASSDAGDGVGEIIPDRYLNRAIEACCTDDYGRFQASKPVRKLITRHAPAGRPTMNAIPQKRRRQFLNELALMTGRALPPDEPIRAEPALASDEPIWAEPTLASQDARLIANGYKPIAVDGKTAVATASSTAARGLKRGPSQAGIIGALLEAAFGYAEGGIPVFPCNPDNKRPMTEHGFRDATTDPEKIRSWWREHPQAMIGVPTGPASGIFVIDLDVNEEKGVDGRKAYKELCKGDYPVTIFQQTPRSGLHFLFRDDGLGVKNSAGKLGPGIDVRGVGGYIVIAPSVMTGGKAYRWGDRGKAPGFPGAARAPEWLLDLCLERKRQPEAKRAEAAPSQQDQAASADQTPPSAAAAAVLEQECNTVASAPEGTRNDTLNKGGLQARSVDRDR
jgi:hypothetical protein